MVLITNTDYTFRDVLAVTSDRVRDLRSRSRSTAIAFGITIGIWIEIEIVQSIGIAIGKRVSTEIAIAIVFPLWALLDLDPDRNSNCPIEIQKFWISIGHDRAVDRDRPFWSLYCCPKITKLLYSYSLNISLSIDVKFNKKCLCFVCKKYGLKNMVFSWKISVFD